MALLTFGVSPGYMVIHFAVKRLIVFQQTMPSKRPTILLRLDKDAKAALIKVAKADDRSAQYVLEKIVLDWLRANGHLVPEKRSK
jgi:hypothetical protein